MVKVKTKAAALTDTHFKWHPVWKDLSPSWGVISLMEGDGCALAMESGCIVMQRSRGTRAVCVREKPEEKLRGSLACSVEWRKSWSDCAVVCLLGFRQLLGKECVAYIHSPDPLPPPCLCFFNNTNTLSAPHHVLEAAYQQQQSTETLKAHGAYLLSDRDTIQRHTIWRRVLR